MMLAARLRAIIRQRCPVCLQGAMFRGRFEMNTTCPVCGHRFEREPGFFQGAMYVSYGIRDLGAPERRHAQTLMSPAHGAVGLLSGRRRGTIKRTSSSRNPSV